MKHIVSTPKAVISGLSTAFFWGYALLYAAQQSWGAFLLFGVLGLVFFRQFVINASYVEADKNCICLRFAGIRRKQLLWTEVRELGVIGESVFSRAKKGKRKSGEKFIYISSVKRTTDERFQMIVNWPLKDGVYMEYTPQALERLQYLWNGPAKFYNVEDLYPNTEDADETEP